MSAADELIHFANEAFYTAFASADADAMDGVWAKDAGLACMHPGAPPLFDRAAIMESWRQILDDPGVTHMAVSGARIIHSAPLAIVVCFETLGEATLVATNGFVQERGVWRMVLHQAGPCPEGAAPVPDDERTTQLH